VEGLSTPDGKPVELTPVAEAEREFNRAMASDVNNDAAPPRRAKPADADPESRPARSRNRPGKNARAAKPAPKPQSDADRKSGIQGLVQLGAMACLMIDQRTPDTNIAFKADAITLANASDAISDAVVETAKHNAQFAAMVDKITSAGPYAALIGVTFQVGMQLAANHGVKAAQMMGAGSPEAVVASVEAQQAA
jgi:hypothetical protein